MSTERNAVVQLTKSAIIASALNDPTTQMVRRAHLSRHRCFRTFELHTKWTIVRQKWDTLFPKLAAWCNAHIYSHVSMSYYDGSVREKRREPCWLLLAERTKERITHVVVFASQDTCTPNHLNQEAFTAICRIELERVAPYVALSL